jgi:hypothetical protein
MNVANSVKNNFGLFDGINLMVTTQSIPKKLLVKKMER